MSRQQPQAARISRHVAAALAGLALLAPAAGRADATGPAAAVLLIANSDYAALPRLPGCVPAMRALADRLRAKGGSVSEQFDAAGPSLQAAIGSFDLHLAAGQKAAIVYCGYVAADADKLFLLPVGTTAVQPADLPRQAIIARTLSRVLSGHDSILVAEMHPAPGAPDLANAVQGLREASAMSTYLDLRTVDGAAAPQIDAFARTVERSAGWPYQAGAGGEPSPATAAATGPGGPAAPPPAPPGPSPASPGTASSAPLAAAEPELSTPAGSAPAHAEPGPARSASAQPSLTQPVPGKPGADKPGAAETTPDHRAAVASAAPADVRDPDRADAGVPAPGASGSDTPAPAKPATPKKPRVPPDNAPVGSPSIRRLQVSLLALGYYNKQIDGLASPATQAAVRAYQRSLKHPETGFLTYGESKELGKVGARK